MTRAFRSVTVEVPDTPSAEAQLRHFAEHLAVREELIVLPRPLGMADEEMPGFVAQLAGWCHAAEVVTSRRPGVEAEVIEANSPIPV